MPFKLDSVLNKSKLTMLNIAFKKERMIAEYGTLKRGVCVISYKLFIKPQRNCKLVPIVALSPMLP